MRLIVMVAAVGCVLSTHNSRGQDDNDQDAIARWMDFYARRAAQYEIGSIEKDELDFKLRSDPLLKYTNPVRGRDQHGAVFAWLRDGRPDMLGTIWSIADTKNPAVRRTAHEVHSLASFPVGAKCPALDDPLSTRAVELAWNLEQDHGVVFLPVESAPAPANSDSLRLAQIRGITRQFSAVSIDRKDDSERPLRLMSTPLMRFQSPASGVIDGCVFAFVLATDPELLVVVEAMEQTVESKQARWRVSPVRFTGMGLRLSHRGEEVWSCSKIDYGSQVGPYRLRIGVSELPATRE